jgi:hypothetical protein
MQTEIDALKLDARYLDSTYNSRPTDDKEAWLYAEVHGLLRDVRNFERAYMEHLGVDVPSSEGV